jgi:hypothetical protein
MIPIRPKLLSAVAIGILAPLDPLILERAEPRHGQKSAGDRPHKRLILRAMMAIVNRSKSKWFWNVFAFAISPATKFGPPCPAIKIIRESADR